jgi:hypothetical protein
MYTHQVDHWHSLLENGFNPHVEIATFKFHGSLAKLTMFHLCVPMFCYLQHGTPYHLCSCFPRAIVIVVTCQGSGTSTLAMGLKGSVVKF